MTNTRLLCSASIAILAVTATPALAGDVTGVVIDQTDTVALQSAVIRIPEINRQVVTQRDGSFRITNVPAGSYTIEARYVGAPTETQVIEVPEVGVVMANFMLGGDDAAS